MANHLEFYNKIHGHKLVNTCYDANFMGENGTELFEEFISKNKIPSQAVVGQVANTTDLKNLFRKVR
jgi:hypothetical protein